MISRRPVTTNYTQTKTAKTNILDSSNTHSN